MPRRIRGNESEVHCQRWGQHISIVQMFEVVARLWFVSPMPSLAMRFGAGGHACIVWTIDHNLRRNSPFGCSFVAASAHDGCRWSLRPQLPAVLTRQMGAACLAVPTAPQLLRSTRATPQGAGTALSLSAPSALAVVVARKKSPAVMLTTLTFTKRSQNLT